jgi:hypothetical protein
MIAHMAELLFLPHYADVLEAVVRQADAEGVVDVECRADLDPKVVAAQVKAYGASTGRALSCQLRAGRVEVRPAGSAASRAAHPAAQGA